MLASGQPAIGKGLWQRHIPKRTTITRVDSTEGSVAAHKQYRQSLARKRVEGMRYNERISGIAEG